MKTEYRIITDHGGFTIFAEGVTASCAKDPFNWFEIKIKWANGSEARELRLTFEEALAWAVAAVVVNPVMDVDKQEPEGLPESIPVTDLAFQLVPEGSMYLCEHVGELKHDGKAISIAKSGLSLILTLPAKHGRANARYLLELGKVIKDAGPKMFALIGADKEGGA